MNDWLERYQGYLVVVLIQLIALAAVVFILRRPTQGLVEILPPPTTTPAPTATPVVMKVHVSGAVAEPGVYSLPEDSRVQQAVEAAGGLTEDATEAGVNLALPLVDGQQVYVPREGEAATPVAAVGGSPASAPASSNAGSVVNINTASVEELQTLPSIGPAIAGRIVEYRDNNGPFRVIEDIKQVSGIGDATFEKLKELITVR